MDILDLILHFEKYLPGFIAVYGFWTYLILFLIIFCETGLVVLPYLPGDSLLFIGGTLAGAGLLNVAILIVILIFAAALGDSVNYWIGNTMGMKAMEKSTFVKKHHLERTEEFFSRYGMRTIVIARFIPVIRTIAPFIAGVGMMNYRRFMIYNVLGGSLWVLLFVLAGYFVGRIPFVQEHFIYILFAIIGISLLAAAPVIIDMVRNGQPHPAEEESEKIKKE